MIHAMKRPLLAFLVLAVAAGPPAAQDTAAPAEPAEPDHVVAARARILDIAHDFATLEWTAEERHVRHGEDPDGTWVDTPDATFDPEGFRTDGSTNVGMPYAWGGFSSLEQFADGLAAGRIAGHVPSTEHMAASRHTLGVDCSGYVARCWDLPVKQSTRTLGALCYELPGYDDLRPGDVINKFDSHVALFKEWADAERTQMRVYEAARLRVEENVYPVDLARRLGFVPMRYKSLDARWVPMDDLVAEVHFGEEPGRFVPLSIKAPKRGKAETLGPATPGPRFDLGDARPGDWLRYAVSDDGFGVDLDVERTVLLARRDRDRLEVQSSTRMLDGAVHRGADWTSDTGFIRDLLDFVHYEEPPGPMELTFLLVEEEGRWVHGEQRLPARRIEARLVGSRTVRHADYPFEVDATVVVVEGLPLHGIAEATFVSRTTWARPNGDGEGEGEDAPVSVRTMTFALRAFGRGED